MSSSKYIWRPQPRQCEFLKRREYECLYGGAAGGGKSEAAVMLPLYWVHIPHFKALILRKTYNELQELIDKAVLYYSRAYPRAKYNDSKHRWTFPSGATITFGSMHTAKDMEKYRGRQFDLIVFDELTHFTWAEYSFMFSRNRPSGAGTFVGIRATTNPGGVGHGWVKSRFITCAPPLTPIQDEFTIALPDGTTETRRRQRIFVPATVFDNPILLNNDPDYIANLAMMPKAQRDAQLYGSWDSYDGQVFLEWRDDPAHYEDRKFTHVIAPFKPPAHWQCWRGFDWGYAKPFSVGWYVADEEGKLYRVREYYGSDGTPDVGVEMDPVQVAAKIREIEETDPLLKGRQIFGVADPAIFSVSSGISIADQMANHPYFVMFSKGDNTRIAGKMQYHYRLAFDEVGDCKFQVFSSCVNFIRTIPSLVYSQSDVEDVDTKQEDHIYDECRYVMMANPISPRAKSPIQRPVVDPFGRDVAPLDLLRYRR